MQIIRCKRFRAIGWQESASVTPAKLFPNRGTYSNKRGNQTQHELGSNGRSCRSRGRCRGWGAGGRRARDSRGLDSSGCAGGRVGVLLGRRLCARRIVADIAVLGGRVLRADRANEEKEEEAPQGGDGTKGSHFRWLWILIEAGKKRMNLENATRTDRQDGNGLGRLAPFLVLFEDTAERRRCARPQCPQAKSGLCYLRFPSGGFGSSSSHSSRLAPVFWRRNCDPWLQVEMNNSPRRRGGNCRLTFPHFSSWASWPACAMLWQPDRHQWIRQLLIMNPTSTRLAAVLGPGLAKTLREQLSPVLFWLQNSGNTAQPTSFWLS